MKGEMTHRSNLESRRFGRCCLENCDRGRQRRGLCKQHYDAALRVVGRGETTWARLAENGKAIVWSLDKEALEACFKTEKEGSSDGE